LARCPECGRQPERVEKTRYTHNLTMNGWLMAAKIFFSFFTCSTCFRRMTSFKSKILSAQYRPVVFLLSVCLLTLLGPSDNAPLPRLLMIFSWHKQTRPKVPVPVIQFHRSIKNQCIKSARGESGARQINVVVTHQSSSESQSHPRQSADCFGRGWSVGRCRAPRPTWSDPFYDSNKYKCSRYTAQRWHHSFRSVP
jgi:hypothetical protein